jgi:hypothetical protein
MESSDPEKKTNRRPSRPPVHIVAAATCTQSARNGKNRPSAAAWLSCVRVMSSRAAVPLAAHQ